MASASNYVNMSDQNQLQLNLKRRLSACHAQGGSAHPHGGSDMPQRLLHLRWQLRLRARIKEPPQGLLVMSKLSPKIQTPQSLWSLHHSEWSLSVDGNWATSNWY